MAESKYALVLTTMNGGAGYNATGPASGQMVIDALTRPLAELKLAVLTASQDIRLLIKEQVRLRDVMAALQSLAKVNLAAPAAVAASEPKSKLTAAIEQRPPPHLCRRPWRFRQP